MFGIVLWSAAEEGSAVVWCEDQGDLAYLRPGTGRTVSEETTGLNAGDLVQFDLTREGDMRLVENPRLVEQRHYPSLADRLKETGRPDVTMRAGQVNTGDMRLKPANRALPCTFSVQAASGEGAVIVPFPRAARGGKPPRHAGSLTRY